MVWFRKKHVYLTVCIALFGSDAVKRTHASENDQIVLTDQFTINLPAGTDEPAIDIISEDGQRVKGSVDGHMSLITGQRPLGQVSLPGVMYTMLWMGVSHYRVEDLPYLVDLLAEFQKSASEGGGFPWFNKRNDATDGNGTQFIFRRLMIFYLQYGSLLPGIYQTKVVAMLNRASNAVLSHRVDIRYTNIYLSQIANLLVFGEKFSGQSSAAQNALAIGKSNLSSWINLSLQEGVREYSTPQYYAENIYALSYALKFVNNPSIKSMLSNSLNYFWTDLAATWVANAGDMIGPHSRDYNPIRVKSDMLQPLMAYVGWRENKAQDAFPPEAIALKIRPTGSKTESLRTMSHKIIERRYGSASGNKAKSIITEGMSFGAASSEFESGCHYPFVMRFPEGLRMPVGIYYMNGGQDPYTLSTARLSAAMMADVSRHFDPQMVSAVTDRDVLFAAAGASNDKDYYRFTPSPAGIFSNFVLPDNPAVVRVDGVQVPAGNFVKKLSLSAKNPSIVTVEHRGSIAGFRVIGTSVSRGVSANNLVIARDELGSSVGAIRMTSIHANSPVRADGAIAFWSRIATPGQSVSQLVAEMKSAKATYRYNRGRLFSVAVSGRGINLSLAENPVSGAMQRQVPSMSQQCVLRVNGVDVGREALMGK